MMKVCALTLVAVSGLFAADEAQLALTLKAQTEFERVELPSRPQLRDAITCVQSQAGRIPVAAPEELALAHFRKGYCTLAVANLTSDRKEYAAAADEFDKAIASWPLRQAKAGKKTSPEPVSSGLQILDTISHFLATGNDLSTSQIQAAEQAAACTSNVMQTDVCRQLLDIGRLWLGWSDLRTNNLVQAAWWFDDATITGWPAWVAGRRAFDSRSYSDATARYAEAISVWKARWASGSPPLLPGLEPRPDLATAWADLGAAQLLAGDAKTALETLDIAVRAAPAEARPLFLRALAHERLGQPDLVLSDYNLASRTAFANSQDLASGEAHLYRGIWFYRRRDFGRAENEFASALNFEIPAVLRPDAVAWRQMAAVASGSCGTAREYLGRALATVSPYFPLEEARSLAAGCVTVQSNGISKRQ